MKEHRLIFSILSVFLLFVVFAWGFFIGIIFFNEKKVNIFVNELHTEYSKNETKHPNSTLHNRRIPPLLLLSTISLIVNKKDFILADLSEKKLKFYKNGYETKAYPILVSGKEGSWGETPAGFFDVLDKQNNHFSSLGQVYQPWNIRFWGNYSIHGWPYNPDGTLTSELERRFSSGCINLLTNDAKNLFSLVNAGFPILVTNKKLKNDEFDYSKFNYSTSSLRDVSANSYLVADLKSGFVFAEKSPDLILPIASVTKLMTAVVSSEYFLLSYKKEKMSAITITEEMLKPIGNIDEIVLGKNYTYFELLYPLLINSSNDAAQALAIEFRGNFINVMNKRAASLEMKSTHFADSFGYDENNVSTANDLYYLARYLLSNRRWILDISRGKIFNEFGGVSFKKLKNLNLFYKDPSFIGGKVGATLPAKKTGVFIFELEINKEKRPIAVIVLGAEDNKKDAEKILDWMKVNFGIINNNLLNDKNL